MFSTPMRKPGGSSSSMFSKTPVGRRAMSRNGTPRRPNTAGLAMALKEQDPVQVFCRVKPLSDSHDSQGCIQIRGEREVCLTPPDNPQYWRQNQSKEMIYTFSKVFGEAGIQKALFDEVALPLVEDVIAGKNALLFAYGVTGSGKTYTMSGNPSDCGIMPRCLDVIFNSIGQYKAMKYLFKPDRMNGFESQTKDEASADKRRDITEKMKMTPRSRPRNPANDPENFAIRQKDETVVPVREKDKDYFFAVFITHIEIYNNFVYDLLDETPISTGKNALQSKMLREDASHNVYVNGVTEVEVESPAEAFEVFQRGLRRRRIAHTALNTESSRSHSIFNIRLVRAPASRDGDSVSPNKEDIIVTQLSLVDLAGSERYSRTGATGDRLKEAGNINNSLMTLRKCMDILRENDRNGTNKVVPFRDSKLTHFLKNYFEGEGCVRMILCVNPRSEDYDENMHVLSFAEQAQEVQITRPQERKIPEVQVQVHTPGRVRANGLYKEAIRQLEDAGVVQEGILPRTNTEFVFNNIPLPICHITKSNEAEVIAVLKKALELRLKGQGDMRRYIQDEQEAFRRELMEMEREYETMKHENSSMKVKIQTMAEEKTNNESVLRQIMMEKVELQSKCEEKDQHLNQLEEELRDLRMQFRQREKQYFKEKELLRDDLDKQRELDELKRKRALQQKAELLKDKYRDREATLAAVKQLVTNVEVKDTNARLSRSRHRSRDMFFDLDSSTTTSSEPDLASLAARSSSAKMKGTRSRAPSAPVLPVVGGTPGFGSSHLRKTPVGVPVARRPRARSTDQDIWVEHTVGLVCKDQTVFQPQMKKKKSITQLRTADDIPQNASKYCLRTQEQDSEGEVETKLYKGDVLPTVGGGAQVVFNDVEVLRQESPTGISPRKRRSSGLLTGLGLVSSSPFRNRSLHYEENPEELADKCKLGVGSSIVSTKRSRTNI